MVFRNQRMKEATGAALFGLDSSRYPAWWADALVVCENQRVEEHNAREAARERE